MNTHYITTHVKKSEKIMSRYINIALTISIGLFICVLVIKAEPNIANRANDVHELGHQGSTSQHHDVNVSTASIQDGKRPQLSALRLEQVKTLQQIRVRNLTRRNISLHDSPQTHLLTPATFENFPSESNVW